MNRQILAAAATLLASAVPCGAALTTSGAFTLHSSVVFRSTAPAMPPILSDRNNKENMVPVNAASILERLVAMPITSWNYKTQPASIRHIGPTAQDFYAAFQVGEDNLHINPVDADGVSLAAIQGLNQRMKERDARIALLEARQAALEQEMAVLRK